MGVYGFGISGALWDACSNTGQ